MDWQCTGIYSFLSSTGAAFAGESKPNPIGAIFDPRPAASTTVPSLYGETKSVANIVNARPAGEVMAAIYGLNDYVTKSEL
jgi:hypothetical protein